MFALWLTLVESRWEKVGQGELHRNTPHLCLNPLGKAETAFLPSLQFVEDLVIETKDSWDKTLR